MKVKLGETGTAPAPMPPETDYRFNVMLPAELNNAIVLKPWQIIAGIIIVYWFAKRK